MTLTDVTTLMKWIDDHRIDSYVSIPPLKDAILDLFESAQIVEVLSPLLTETEI